MAVSKKRKMMLYFFPLISGIQVLDYGFFEGGTCFRVPIVSGTPDSTSKNFAVSGFSQGRISQIPEFLTRGDMDNRPCHGFRRHLDE